MFLTQVDLNYLSQILGKQYIQESRGAHALKSSHIPARTRMTIEPRSLNILVLDLKSSYLNWNIINILDNDPINMILTFHPLSGWVSEIK